MPEVEKVAMDNAAAMEKRTNLYSNYDYEGIKELEKKGIPRKAY